MITAIAKKVIPHVIQSALKDARDYYRVRVTEVYPWAFNMSQLRTNHASFLVTQKTDVLITGFPRSGNSCAVRAFLFMQPVDTRPHVAHHIHLISEIRRAVAFSIPVVVVIRNPLESISSLALRAQIPLDVALLKYHIYYAQLLQLERWLIVSSFETTTKHPNLFVEALNAKYGSDYQSRKLGSNDDAAIKSEIANASMAVGGDFTKIAIPSAEKSGLLDQLQKELLASDRYQRSLSHCQKLFDGVSKFAV